MSKLCKSVLIVAMALVAFGANGRADENVGMLNQSDAAKAAITRTGGGQVRGTAIEQKDGRPHYMFMIVDGDTRFDVAVDAMSGAVSRYARREIQGVKSQRHGMAGREFRLNPAEVEETAATLSGGGTLVRSDIARKADGRTVYDVECVRDGILFAMEIDANSGDVVKYEERLFAGATSVELASK